MAVPDVGIQVPEPLATAVAILRERMIPDARVQATSGNFAYLLLPRVHFPPAKYPAPHSRPVWVRMPHQFPLALPHGIVTTQSITTLAGSTAKGHNEGGEMCAPVAPLDGRFYYSWTWDGELGSGPALNAPADILKVVGWVERRIRNA